MNKKHFSRSIHVLMLVVVVGALAVAGGAAKVGGGSVAAAAITPPTQADVNAAVTRGVGFLDKQQNLDGSFGSSFYITADTEFALISYGVFDGGDFSALSPARQTIVKNAVTWLLGQQDKTGTSTDGNWGLNDGAATYEGITFTAFTALGIEEHLGFAVLTDCTHEWVVRYSPV